MFSYRGLFLIAVIISLASIALAGVLVQPGYKYHIESNPRYSASTESSKSKIIAHDNDVPAKLFLPDAIKHAITFDQLRKFLENQPTTAKLFNKRLEHCQAVKNFLLSIRLGSTISLTNITRPEHEPTDLPNDKRVENCQADNNFIILYVEQFLNSTISSTNITLPEYKDANVTDKRLENCHIVQNILLGISLGSTISLPNITRPEHEPTDLPNDKRLKNCQVVNNYIILHIRIFLNALKAISSTNITHTSDWGTDIFGLSNAKGLDNCMAVYNYLFLSTRLMEFISLDELNPLKNMTLPGQELTDLPNDKRLENCHIVKDILLGIRLGSTISLTNISLRGHEPTDTNVTDKRVENCQADNNFIILYIQLLLSFLKAISSTKITLPEHELTDTNYNAELVEGCHGWNDFVISFDQQILYYLEAISSEDWTSEHIKYFPFHQSLLRQGLVNQQT